MHRGVLTMPVRLYLIKIICLDVARYEVRAEESSCGAIVHAMDRYPQACRVVARPIGGRA